EVCMRPRCPNRRGSTRLVEDVISLVVHDLLGTHIGRTARHGWRHATLGSRALNVGHAGHGATAHGRVGLHQLERDVARAARSYGQLGPGELGAVHAFPGRGRAVVFADLLAAAVHQLRIGT